MQFAPRQQDPEDRDFFMHKRDRSVPKNSRQLKEGDQVIEEEEKKEEPVNISIVKNKKATDAEVEREVAALEMMAREYYDPQSDTAENYSTFESEYGSYTNKRFSVVYLFSVIFSSELDMPWVKSLFDRTNDF